MITQGSKIWVKEMIMKWLNKGDGGEWYEPFVSNFDLIIILLITLFVSGIIIIGGSLI